MPDPGRPAGDVPSYLQPSGADTLLRVRVIPRSGRTGLAGERAGALLVRLAAAPVDGAANTALVAYLAGCLAVPRQAITLVGGDRSRDKRLRIAGVPAVDVARRLRHDAP